jgi:nucleoside-diphosphate-sugar epimerase
MQSSYKPQGSVCLTHARSAAEEGCSQKVILNNDLVKTQNSLDHIVNVYYPDPVTILELAEIVRESIIECTSGKVRPKIEIADNGIPPLFTEEDKNRIKVDVNKAKKLLGLEKLKSPKESIREILKLRTHRN